MTISVRFFTRMMFLYMIFSIVLSLFTLWTIVFLFMALNEYNVFVSIYFDIQPSWLKSCLCLGNSDRIQSRLFRKCFLCYLVFASVEYSTNI